MVDGILLAVMSVFMLWKSYDCCKELEDPCSREPDFLRAMKMYAWVLGVSGVGCLGVAMSLTLDQVIGYLDRKVIIVAIAVLLVCAWVTMYTHMFQWRKAHKVFTERMMYKPTPTRVMVVLSSLGIILIDMGLLVMNYPGRL
jgi:hypothetical protein